ncbi:hypothetical protein M9458_047003, partial [Cirrhinus mrigala]
MMELALYDMNTGQRCSYDQMSLAEMLEVQDHPVSEEQAWALCYQLCSILSHRCRVVVPRRQRLSTANEQYYR